jgi:hypothetical protein
MSTGKPSAVNAACSVWEGAVGKGPQPGHLAGGLLHRTSGSEVRVGETDRPKRRHRAPGRPYLHSWMNGYGKLRRCTEKAGEVVDFYLHLATALVTLRMLIRRATKRYRWDGRALACTRNVQLWRQDTATKRLTEVMLDGVLLRAVPTQEFSLLSPLPQLCIQVLATLSARRLLANGHPTRFALGGLAAEADLFRLLQRDGPDFPDLTMQVHEQLVQRGYDFAIAAFSRLLQARGLPAGDVAALAAIALGSLVHFREDEALYGKTPAGATEEQFVAAWVDIWLRVLASRAAEAKRHDG